MNSKNPFDTFRIKQLWIGNNVKTVKQVFINHRQQAYRTTKWNNSFQILDKKQWKTGTPEKSKTNDIKSYKYPGYQWRQFVCCSSRKDETRAQQTQLRREKLQFELGQGGQNIGHYRGGSFTVSEVGERELWRSSEEFLWNFGWVLFCTDIRNIPRPGKNSSENKRLKIPHTNLTIVCVLKSQNEKILSRIIRRVLRQYKS